MEGIGDWERTVILELNREHESVRRTYKVNLRPIGIALFDSDTLWGQFDNLTRTISISRKLVNEHSWDKVMGVFRHEMAHQWVAEQNGARAESDKPHGELFKQACQRLGVPDQFAKAGLDLQSCVLDWRSEPRDEAAEKILDRVKKLMALATSANEHEALLAMEKVRELYAKYNLEHMEALSRESFIHLIITHGKKRMASWMRRVISILTEHFFVEVLTFQQFEPKTGKRVHAIEVIGTAENVLMAEYVYHFLVYQVEQLVKAAATSAAGLQRWERTSFRLGVLDGFAQKLASAEAKMSEDPAGPAQSVVGQALEKFRSDPKLKRYLKEIYPRLGSWRGSSLTIDCDAFAAGHSAGKSITLNKPISSQGGRGKILPARA